MLHWQLKKIIHSLKFIFQVHQVHSEGNSLSDGTRLQVYFGISWIFGCFLFGGLIVNGTNSLECKISRQYLCQTSLLMCGLTLLAFNAVDGYKGYVIFVWCFGFLCGGYFYSLKMYIYEKVRSRNFGRTWGFAQLAMGFPTLIGVPITGYINNGQPMARGGYLFSALMMVLGSMVMMLINFHKNRLKNKRKQCRQKRNKLLSEISLVSVAPDGAILLPTTPGFDINSANNSAVFLEPSNHEEAVLVQSGVPSTGCIYAAEVVQKPDDDADLSDYSDEGIAGIDIPENIFEELEFADNITSCNKVENVLMLSEYEQNLSKEKEWGPKITPETVPGQVRRGRKWSFLKQSTLPRISSGDSEEAHSRNEVPVFANTTRRLHHHSQLPFKRPMTIIDEDC